RPISSPDSSSALYMSSALMCRWVLLARISRIFIRGSVTFRPAFLSSWLSTCRTPTGLETRLCSKIAAPSLLSPTGRALTNRRSPDDSPCAPVADPSAASCCLRIPPGHPSGQLLQGRRRRQADHGHDARSGAVRDGHADDPRSVSSEPLRLRAVRGFAGG